MTTRTMLAVVLCVTVVLAGCAGLGGGGDETTASGANATDMTTAAADTTTADDGGTTAAGDAATTAAEGGGTTVPTIVVETPTTMMSDDTTMATTAMPTTVSTPGETMVTTVGNMAGNSTFRFLAFEQPGTYTYEITFAPTVSTRRGTAEPGTRQGGKQTGQYVIDVVQASETQYEVRVSLTMGQLSNQQTFTGTRREVQRQMLSSQVGVFLAPLTTMTGFYGGRSLQVGQSWSYSSQQGSVSFEVTGTDSYAGVECFVSKASVNGTVIHEACVSPDRGLAPYAAYYDGNGNLTFQMTLQSYEAK